SIMASIRVVLAPMWRRDSGLGKAVWHAAAAYRITSMAVPFPVLVAVPMYGKRWSQRSKALVLYGCRTLLFMGGGTPRNNGSADSKRVHEGGLIFSTTDKRSQHLWRRIPLDLTLPMLIDDWENSTERQYYALRIGSTSLVAMAVSCIGACLA